ncbi:SDR family NAD(P)-dependent oxidoreductase [Pollutimonas harenae]|uniref:Glucose 1-dehydrogenase n=1 Tax=Pollutimonas harenae TaxID=657015 RepID=A0A853GRC3_9BURK|nr:glucose 1-dehydrogenase [Pollutimonas harenae]NYT84711.1 glucose 1-dehydrogenase [Pollutimonas harenae]TEA72887.1 glucose 1-dehydrogenase [Pollutimonas harenae]
MTETTIAADMLARLAQGKTFQDLAGKVVFITGAGNGIGLAMARAFAACDARLALLDINGPALQAACTSLQAEFPGVQVQTCVAAVNDEAAVHGAVQAVHAAFGRLDILLNNAGISMNQPTLKLSGELWRKAMDVNVNGVFYCAQAVGRHMVEQGSGVILNVSSMYGTIAAPERAAYCTSKAAVAMLTKVLAIEWAGHGIRVNAIAPGYVKTALVEELVAEGRMDLDALTRRTPVGRLGEPHEIATLAVFLASEHAAFINGHVAVADGGWSAYSYI